MSELLTIGVQKVIGDSFVHREISLSIDDPSSVELHHCSTTKENVSRKLDALFVFHFKTKLGI